MEMWAVIFFALTIPGGLLMLGITLRAGNDGVTSNLPSGVVFGHVSAALLAIGFFSLALGYDERSLMWAAFVTLLLTAGGGAYMFVRWQKDRMGPAEEVEARKARLAEQQIPSPVVHLHGAFAALTIVAVLLVALGIG